jgi:hypothetical protein
MNLSSSMFGLVPIMLGRRSKDLQAWSCGVACRNFLEPSGFDLTMQPISACQSPSFCHTAEISFTQNTTPFCCHQEKVALLDVEASTVPNPVHCLWCRVSVMAASALVFFSGLAFARPFTADIPAVEI